MKITYKDNAFWDDDQNKNRIKCIRVIEQEDGVTSTEVVTINKFDPETGQSNPDWDNVLQFNGGEEGVEKNTEIRKDQKQKREERERIQREDHERAKKLEKLFNAKLQAFEIDEISNSTNRALKTKLRRAKNILEVNIYAMMIVMEYLENESTE